MCIVACQILGELKGARGISIISTAVEGNLIHQAAEQMRIERKLRQHRDANHIRGFTQVCHLPSAIERCARSLLQSGAHSLKSLFVGGYVTGHLDRTRLAAADSRTRRVYAEHGAHSMAHFMAQEYHRSAANETSVFPCFCSSCGNLSTFAFALVVRF